MILTKIYICRIGLKRHTTWGKWWLSLKGTCYALTHHGYVRQVLKQLKSITQGCKKVIVMNVHMSVVTHCVATFTNQAFWQKSGNDRAFSLVGCEKKSHRAWAAKIRKPDISSVSEKAFSGVWYDCFGVFILAKTRCLELTTNNLTKDQYVETTMAFMKKWNVFDKKHAKWFDTALNVHLEDGSKQLFCLKQRIGQQEQLENVWPLGYHWCVSLESRCQPSRGSCTQKNTQGVWPCKSTIDSLLLQQLALSSALMSCLSKQPRRFNLTSVAR